MLQEIIINIAYTAHNHCDVPMRFITPAHQTQKSFPKPSQLPGENTAQLLPFWRIHGSSNTKTTSALSRYPFTPGWREAITVKRLAQGYKHHNRSQDLNILTTWPSEHESNTLNFHGASI